MTTEKILSAIAHFELAIGASKEVRDLQGFADFYKGKLNRAQITLLRRYEKIKTHAAADLVIMMEGSKPLVFAANELPQATRGMVGAVNVALFAADGPGNEAGQEITLADRWFQVSPYGEFPNAVGLQVFDQQASDEIISAFNSLPEQLGRGFKGLPIYIGHPDYDPKEYPDKRRYGSITQLEAREDGLFAKAKWSAAGREAVNEEHFVFQSPHWGMREFVHNGQKAFRPALLESVGLTNNPNIRSVLPVGVNEKQTAGPKPLSSMTKESLIKKFNLVPATGATEVTDEQIEAAVDAALNAPVAVRQALGTKLGLKLPDGVTEYTDDVFAGAFTGLQTNVATVSDARDGAILEAAVNEGRITAGEKPGWLTRLKADFNGATAALKGLTPAINVRPAAAHTADLGARNGGNQGAAKASEQFTHAVNERVARGDSFDVAWAACKTSHKSLYDQMQAPKGLEG